MPAKVEISHKTILFTVFFLVLLWLLIQIKDIIFLVFIAFILMSALKPVVELLEKIRIVRPLAILLVYIVVLLFLTFIGSSILPPLVTQTIFLGRIFPEYIKSVFPFVKIDPQVISQQVTPFSENLFKVTIGVFSNVVALFTILVISFYLLLERKHLELHLAEFMGEKGAKMLISIISKVEERLGAWLRGQLTLMLVIGLSTYIGLVFLGIPFVLPLAILAGILEIVPIIGPIISAIPAVILALTISPLLAVATAVLYFVIQQLENNLLVPMVMRQAVGLPPLVTITALMIGAKLAGVTGAILAVPVVVTVETLFSEYLKLKKP